MSSRVLLTGLVMGVLHVAFGQTQLIVNGGFESGVSPWNLSSTTTGPGVVSDAANAHTGANFLSMGQSANTDQKAYQDVTIPSNAVNAALGYFWAVTSTDPSGFIALQTTIRTTGNAVLATVDTQANTFGSTSGYQQKIFDLTPYIGQTVRVEFELGSSGGSGANTQFGIDDVQAVFITTNDFPRNDYFTNRIVLTGSSTNVTGTNTFATREPGEPKISNKDGGHSLWWAWTAPSNGVLTLNTHGSTFDTMLGVFTGSSVSNLTLVAQNNNQDISDLTSKVKTGVSAGTQYQIAVDGNDAFGTILLSLSFVPDTTAPKVTISSPAANAKVTNSTIIVTGTASDNVAIDRVEFRLENADGTNTYQVADGTNSWTATVTDLIPGNNTVRVRSIDTSGNVSSTVARTFDYVIVSPFTLTINGGGTVSPNLNGQLLEIGASFTVTAKPTAGNIFAGWTGDLTAGTPALTFTMQSNLTLQANFIANPFTPVAGTYQGLFYDTNGAAHHSSGFFSATVTSAGTFSAKLILGGASASLSGTFSATGVASNNIVRKGQPPVTAQLQLDLAGNALTGVLSDGTWTSELNAFRAGGSAPSGRYTLVLPGGDNASTEPGGDGYGTVLVDALGNVTFSGVLGDGTKVAQKKVLLSPAHQWPFYVSLYSGQGSIFGWLTFSNQVDSDITGTVDWFKLAQPTAKLYRNGFTNETEAAGSVYQFTAGVPVLNFTTGEVSLVDGNLSQNITNDVTLGADSKVTNNGSNALALTITTSTGLFKGTAANPAGGKAIPFTGVVLQKQNYGAGFFLGTTESGRVRFGP